MKKILFIFLLSFVFLGMMGQDKIITRHQTSTIHKKHVKKHKTIKNVSEEEKLNIAIDKLERLRGIKPVSKEWDSYSQNARKALLDCHYVTPYIKKMFDLYRSSRGKEKNILEEMRYKLKNIKKQLSK